MVTYGLTQDGIIISVLQRLNRIDSAKTVLWNSNYSSLGTVMEVTDSHNACYSIKNVIET